MIYLLAVNCALLLALIVMLSRLSGKLRQTQAKLEYVRELIKELM